MTTQTDRINGLTGALGLKAPVRVATTANITLSGEQTIDGVAVVALDRVLVKDQTTATENGIYVASATAWARAPDFDGTRDAVTGTMIYVVSGTTNAKTSWRISTTGDLTPGTTSLTFEAAFGTPLIALDTHAATTKATPVDADELPLVDSAASWVLKKITLTTLWTWITTHAGTTYAALAGSASQAFAALAVNTAKTTVASATTPDIFAVTTGQLIDYTGTATCTGFVAAPQAGMFRELYCADACSFTAGANLLIEGIPSGTTITLAAGAVVQVRSITTTQFKMTYSLSGTFTATATVSYFTVEQTTTASYEVENGVVTVTMGTLSGTSNATTLRITGAPAAIFSSTEKYLPLVQGMNNGVVCLIRPYIAAGTATYEFAAYIAGALGAFTSSGTKSLQGTTFSYSIY